MRALLANRFLPAFLATLEELAEGHYFASREGDRCSICGKPYYWTATRVARALTAEAGSVNWSLGPAEGMPGERVITYVEAFYQIVSKPKDIAPGQDCGISHPSRGDR